MNRKNVLKWERCHPSAAHFSGAKWFHAFQDYSEKIPTLPNTAIRLFQFRENSEKFNRSQIQSITFPYDTRFLPHLSKQLPAPAGYFKIPEAENCTTQLHF